MKPTGRASLISWMFLLVACRMCSKMLEDLSAAQKTFLRYPKGCSGFQQKPEWLLDAFKKSSEIRGSWAQHIRTSSKLFQLCLGGPWAPSDVGWLAHALNPQELNAQMRREKIYRTWMPIRRVIAGHCYRKFHSTAMASIHFCLDGHKETRLWDLLITKKTTHGVYWGRPISAKDVMQMKHLLSCPTPSLQELTSSDKPPSLNTSLTGDVEWG